MSNFKIHLPFYTKKILLKIFDLVNDHPDIIVQRVKNLDNDYTKIGNFIFDKKNKNKKIILLGKFDKMLPIPRFTKFLLKDTEIKKKDKKNYERMNYVDVTEKDFIENIDTLIENESEHRASFKLGSKKYTIDVYKLWFVSNDKSPVKLRMKDIQRVIFGTDDLEEIKSQPIWGETSLNDIVPESDHMMRITMADLDIPILFSNYKRQFQMIDGMHRLAKAILLKNKYIYGIEISKDDLSLVK
jgi:hypothetical protein